MVEQGINGVRQQLDGTEFPATTHDLRERIGDRRVRAGDRTMPMRDVLEQVQRTRYETPDELIRDIQDHVPGFKQT